MIIPTGKSFAREVNEMGASGLSAGLKALANMKLQEMQQSRQAQRRAPFYEQYGISPDAGYLSESAQNQLIRQQPQQQQQGGGWQNDLTSILQMLSGQQGGEDGGQQGGYSGSGYPQGNVTNPFKVIVDQILNYTKGRSKKKSPSLKKTPKRLTQRIVDHYLLKANYDSEKAKAMAEKAGYGV